MGLRLCTIFNFALLDFRALHSVGPAIWPLQTTCVCHTHLGPWRMPLTWQPCQRPFPLIARDEIVQVELATNNFAIRLLLAGWNIYGIGNVSDTKIEMWNVFWGLHHHCSISSVVHRIVRIQASGQRHGTAFQALLTCICPMLKIEDGPVKSAFSQGLVVSKFLGVSFDMLDQRCDKRQTWIHHHQIIEAQFHEFLGGAVWRPVGAWEQATGWCFDFNK